jgi:hypothetical protein
MTAINKSKTTKTVNLLSLELARARNIPLAPLPYTTLNEALSFGSPTPGNGYPIMNFLAIGNGGHRNALGNDGASVTDSLQHGITDACLFNHIPFLAVPTTADISPVERMGYRGRRVENYNGIDYFFYYLKPLDSVVTQIRLSLIEIVNKVIVSEIPYVPSVTCLTPTPVDIQNSNLNLGTGRYITAKESIGTTLSNVDIANIVEACLIKYGDERRAIISEAALVSGYDTVTPVNSGGVTASITELNTAQVMAFAQVQQPLAYGTTSYTIMFNLADGLPLSPSAVI